MPPKKKEEAASKSKTQTSVATKVVTGKASEITSFLSEVKKMGVLGDITKKIDFISTGSWVIDRLIGDGTGKGQAGGIPRGYMVEIFGDESCGKTTLALHCCKTVQDMNERVVFIDFEHSLRTQQHYIKSLGIDTDPEKFTVLEPDDYEQGVAIMGKALVTMRPALIVIDSLAAALPRAVASGEAGEMAQIGLHAKLTSNILNFFNKKLAKFNCAVIILNQKRSNIKASKYDAGPDEVTTGGRAIRFYPTLRIDLKPKEKEMVSAKNQFSGVAEKKAINQTVKVTIVKNKLDIPWRSAPVYITFGSGIDSLKSIVELAIAKKIIKQAGAWYEYKSPVNSASNFKANGKNQIWQKLSESKALVEEMKPYLLPDVDEEELEEAKINGMLDEDSIDEDDLSDLEELTGRQEKINRISVEESGDLSLSIEDE